MSVFRRSIAITLLLIMVSVPVQAGWTPHGVPVATEINSQSLPVVTMDGAGGAILAWQDRRLGAEPDIWIQRISSSGNVLWSNNGRPVCTAPGTQDHQVVTPDGEGGVFLVWSDRRSGNYDIYAQRVSSSGIYQWAANGVPVCTASDLQGDAAAVSDGAGGLIIAWIDGRNYFTSYDVYAQRMDGSGTPLWTVNGIPICRADRDQFYATIISDGTGGAIIAWEDRRVTTIHAIRAQRVTASGATMWTTNGAAMHFSGYDGERPAIVSDGSGGAIIAWESFNVDVTQRDIHAQHVDASGAIQWTTIGARICVAPGRQIGPKVVSDGAGGALVVWEDERNGAADSDIYVRRVNASGTPLGPADGTPISSAPNEQTSPEVVSDGSGGAIVTWEDNRSLTDFDIYSQRVDASLALVGEEDGVLVSGADDDQLFAVIASDGAGGAIVAWADNRNGVDLDIYVQRASDVAAGIDERTPRVDELTVLANTPNPFGDVTEIPLVLKRHAHLTLEIFDTAGRRVVKRTYADRPPGRQKLRFDGSDAVGVPLPSGVYFYRIRALGASATKKMVILR